MEVTNTGVSLGHGQYQATYSGVSEADRAVIQRNLTTIFPRGMQTVEVSLMRDKMHIHDCRLYLANVDGKKLVIRITNENLGIFQRSLAYSEMAANHGLGPKVVHHNAYDGVLVIDYVDGTHPKPGNTDILEVLGEAVARIHRAEAPKDAQPFPTVVKMIWDINRLISARNQCAEHLQGCLGYLERIKMVMDGQNVQVPCHNDLHVNNIFQTRNGIQFIDWDTGSLNDPFLDLARIASECGLNAEDPSKLLRAYLSRDASPAEQTHFAVMRYVDGVRAALYYVSIGQYDAARDILQLLEHTMSQKASQDILAKFEAHSRSQSQ